VFVVLNKMLFDQKEKSYIFTIHYYLLLPPKIDKELVKSEE